MSGTRTKSANNETQSLIAIPVDAAIALLEYLKARPYRDVAGFIEAIGNGVPVTATTKPQQEKQPCLESTPEP